MNDFYQILSKQEAPENEIIKANSKKRLRDLQQTVYQSLL